MLDATTLQLINFYSAMEDDVVHITHHTSHRIHALRTKSCPTKAIKLISGKNLIPILSHSLSSSLSVSTALSNGIYLLTSVFSLHHSLFKILSHTHFLIDPNPQDTTYSSPTNRTLFNLPRTPLTSDQMPTRHYRSRHLLLPTNRAFPSLRFRAFEFHSPLSKPFSSSPSTFVDVSRTGVMHRALAVREVVFEIAGIGVA